MRGRAGSGRAMMLPRQWLITSVVAAAMVSAGCAPVATHSSDRLEQTGQLIALSGAGAGAANACFTCHGLQGTGDGAGTPRLAGLDMGYLERQLEAYADGRRRHAQMGWIAGQLSPAQRELVSAYYSAMPFAMPQSGPAQASALYVHGDPARGIAACAGCHGPDGLGMGPANPPLAGQPAPYLAAQLEAWSKGKRRNDPGGVMLRISQLLTPSERAAVSAYAASLPAGLPNPGFPEASLAARRDGPRSDASGPPLHVPESARATE